jgi:hypothetical protein
MGGMADPAASRGRVAGAPISCSWCGETVDEVPVTWTLQSGLRVLEYLCESCTRDNVRKIEGSLPTEYW